MVVALVAGLPVSVQAREKVLLRERSAVGEQHAIRLNLQLAGKMQIKSGEKAVHYDLQAKAEHALAERMLAIDKEDMPSRVARFYSRAGAEISVQGTKNERKLRPERQLIVAQRSKGGTLTYAPSGPLTREELELVGEHLDVLAIPGLLPGHEVAVGGTWHVAVPTIQALVGLDGVISEQIVCQLEKISDGEATIRVTGKVEGIYHGAEVKCQVDGELLHDTRASRWTRLTWRQRDERQAGPASPAATTEATTTAVRERGVKNDSLTDDAVAPLSASPNNAQLLIEQRDARGRFVFHHDRNWHVVSQNERFTVLRLMERGELLGQVTVMPHTQERPGEHISAAEFQRRVQATPDFKVDQLLQAGEVPADPGHWVYRISVSGQAGDLQVVQNHYAVAGPKGHQVFFTFITEAALVDRFGARDLAMIGTVVFTEK
jgi:hypothetical protein